MGLSGMRERLAHGVRTSARNNGSAYGYSLMVTSSFGVLQQSVGHATVLDIFTFVGGASMGFVLVEGGASNLFRMRLRGDPPEVVALGSALSFFSVGLGVGVAALTAVVSKLGAWPVGGFLATTVYMLTAGIEMAVAREIEQRTPEEEQDADDESER